MHVSTILEAKGSRVLTISPLATVADAAKAMVNDKCGSLVVIDEGHVVGIITERDILRACAHESVHLSEISVADHMTRRVIVGAPGDEINEIMGLMTDERIRHLPVLADGNLAGIISIGDVVKAQFGHLSMENHYLKHYIQS